MPKEENNPDGSRVVAMLEIINSRAGETRIFATPGEVQPNRMGRLATDSEDLRSDLRMGLAQIGAQMAARDAQIGAQMAARDAQIGALLQALTEYTSKLTTVDQTVQTVQVQAFVAEVETQKQHAATQELLQRQAKPCEAMKAPLQKSSTAQNAQILQIQSHGASTTQQVKLLGKQHEQMRTEDENTNESMTTLEARVKEMHHEHSKLKDNECAWMKINGQQMLALTEDVAQQSKATNALEAKLNEIEKFYTTAAEGNRAAESDAESKRREPIFSPASAMQTAAKLNSRAEGNRGTLIPSPASAMQTARQEDTRQLKSTDSKRRAAMACLEQRQTTAMACLEQRLESFTRDQATLRAEMLQPTAMLCEGKNSLAQLQQRLEKMKGLMQQQAEAMDDFQDVLWMRCTSRRERVTQKRSIQKLTSSLMCKSSKRRCTRRILWTFKRSRLRSVGKSTNSSGR